MLSGLDNTRPGYHFHVLSWLLPLAASNLHDALLFLGYIVNPIGKRAHYYTGIMKEAPFKMRKNGESDDLFKKRFTAERSMQFDILKSKEDTFLSSGCCSKRESEFSMPEYQWKPSDGKKLNLSIEEFTGMVQKLKALLKDVKEHVSTLFRTNGLALKQGEEFAHSVNVIQIECIEAKLTKVTQGIEATENKKRSCDSILKEGIDKQHINKRRRKKENGRKTNKRKKKRTENNVQRVYAWYRC